MTFEPAEIALFGFLAEAVAAAAIDSPLYGLELHDTIYQPILTARGLRISDVASSFGPLPGGAEHEFDAKITVVAFSKVLGQEQADRRPAIADVFEIQRAVYGAIRGNQTLAGRVCDTLLESGSRSFDAYDNEAYAVAEINLVVNPSGESYSRG